MTRQEMYDKLFVRFSKPTTLMGINPQSTSDTSECIYRGNENPASRRKCAVGSCIPNSVYKPAMEGNAVDSLIKNFPEVAAYLPKDIEFVVEVQTEHDVSADLYKEDNNAARMEFLRRLNAVAKRYTLTTQPLPH